MIQLKQVFGLAPGLEVKIGIVAGRAGALNRLLLRFLAELFKTLVDLLRDYVALLDPPFHTGGGPHSQESPLALEHIQSFAVFHQTALGEYGGDVIPQDRLRRRDVDNLLDASSFALATSQKQDGQAGEPKKGARRVEPKAKFHWTPTILAQKFRSPLCLRPRRTPLANRASRRLVEEKLPKVGAPASRENELPPISRA